jgi:hypothetical protein
VTVPKALDNVIVNYVKIVSKGIDAAPPVGAPLRTVLAERQGFEPWTPVKVMPSGNSLR